MKLERYAPDSALAQELIGNLDAELRSLYPEDGATFFDLSREETAEGNGVFLIAFDGEHAVGCGALRKLDEETAELKRMFVRKEARNAGVARLLLRELEQVALGLGVHTLLLETGHRQRDALHFYAREGFAETAPFGAYVSSPLSVCMRKYIGSVERSTT